MHHFAAAELQGDLDLHVVAEEVRRMLELHAQVVGVNLRAELHLLDLGGVLVLPGFLVALGLLVAELAKIYEPANGRGGVGRDFNQVHAACLLYTSPSPRDS